MRYRAALAAALAALAACGPAPAGEGTFTPLAMPQGDTGGRPGMCFCPAWAGAAEPLPLKPRVWPTRESVPGGVAMKCAFEKGSRGAVAYETAAFPAGSAGL